MTFLFYAIPAMTLWTTHSILLFILSWPVALLVVLLFTPNDPEDTTVKDMQAVIASLPVEKKTVVGTEDYNKRYMGLSS